MVKIEVWSDILCPFCFIGKRTLDAALKQFKTVSPQTEVEVIWKSFQLDPSAPRASSMGTYEMLAKKYRQSLDQAKRMTAGVAARGHTVGIEFNFDKTLITNSFDAHRLSHLAAKQGFTSLLEERLFAAHFVEGKNIGDTAVLTQIGIEIGLDPLRVKGMLESTELSAEVQTDLDEADELGITGVPFFVFNRKFAVSGAQPIEVFMKALGDAS